MAYQPNFKDPRVKNRITQALGFATACIPTTKSKTWSTRYIDKWFGISSNNLSKFLRNTLLICTNHHYRATVSKSYKLNAAGVDALRRQLDPAAVTADPAVVQAPEAREWVLSAFGQELATRVFTYKYKSSRLWHPLQRVRREIKQQALGEAGMRYQYDIQCCAPRLLLQHSQQIPERLDPVLTVGPKRRKRPLWLQGPMDLWLPHIQSYLANRTQIRLDLASRLEISPDLAKQIINALFAGARIALNTDSAIYQLLEADIARIHALRQDPFVSELVKEIRIMWQYIAPTIARRHHAVSGRRLPITSREKWHRYFELEYQVICCISRYLTATENPAFTEHDGWTCVHEVDQDCLRTYVREHTGFDVIFDLEILY